MRMTKRKANKTTGANSRPVALFGRFGCSGRLDYRLKPCPAAVAQFHRLAHERAAFT